MNNETPMAGLTSDFGKRKLRSCIGRSGLGTNDRMNQPKHFKIFESHAVFHPIGDVSLEQAVQLVLSAITFAREQQIRKLLTDLTNLTGFESPSIATRYFFIQEWARAAQGRVYISMVAKPEMIDPEKFGVTVAENVGLRCDVFASQEEALAWLQNIN